MIHKSASHVERCIINRGCIIAMEDKSKNSIHLSVLLVKSELTKPMRR